MATNMTPTTTPASETAEQPLVVGCEESQESQTLPVLAEWRERQTSALKTYQPQHAGAERVDQIPREYALLTQE
ncbi:MAG: hypothetical protein KGO05_03260, partial [Chloroflexota bacterium]|nr:hypothetical protein [Chloroflexota bacterium]